MVVLFYSDDGPSGMCGQTLENTRPFRIVFLLDDGDTVPRPSGRKNPRFEIVDKIIDRRKDA